MGLKLNYKNIEKKQNQVYVESTITFNMAATITQISESIFTALEPHAEQVRDFQLSLKLYFALCLYQARIWGEPSRGTLLLFPSSLTP